MMKVAKSKSAKEILAPILGSEMNVILDALTGSVDNVDAVMSGLLALRQEIIDRAKQRLRLKSSFWPDVSPNLRKNARVSWVVFDKETDKDVVFFYTFSKQSFTLGEGETLSSSEMESLRHFRHILPPRELDTLIRLQKRFDEGARKRSAA